MILDPEVETRPWADQLALDDASYRSQLAYLLECSSFYGEKLAGHDTSGGLAAIAELPLTEKDELRATRTADNPIGTHLCAARSEVVRIYSTSATTGAPSYVPLTADDLDNWVTGSARSYAASGISAGQRIVTTYNAGPFVAGAALAAFERIGLCHIGVSLWGECEEQNGMHLGARGFVHAELIDSDSGAALELDDGASGELVLTHLRHRAAPLLRFRTRDHVEVRTGPCRCGRTGPRIRCIGRTDDMLIVRGVNVFPTAVREVVGGFAPEVSGLILVRPEAAGVKQEPPLPVTVELARGASADAGLAEAIRERLRDVLVVQTRVELVPWGTLQRSEYKSKLVER
jgi:phenylacetate-CoA ligase